VMNIPQQTRAQAVCRLEYVEDGKIIGGGTGFHYGGGWILTNSHVVGEDALYLPQIRITFENITPHMVFEPKLRVCFFMDIIYNSNKTSDNTKADVARFRLEESNLPPGMNDQSFNPLAVPLVNNHILVENEKTYCLHYGWRNLPQRPPHILVSQHENVSRIIKSVNTDSPFIIERCDCTTSGGSSGAPLFEETTNELVGIHYAGLGTIGIAVLFSPTVKEILRKIILAIAEVRNLPSVIEMYNNLSGDLKNSARKQVEGRVNNIHYSLGNASEFMRLLVPLSNGKKICFYKCKYFLQD